MFNTKRIREWVEVIKVTKPSPKRLFRMLCQAFKVIKNPIESAEWKRRMRTCYECPVFDPQLKRCRPWGTDMGCGCYTPYSNMQGNQCWGRNNLGERFGWKDGE